MTEWLIDTSALVRLDVSIHAAEWAGRIRLGRVRIATSTLLELGYAARSGEDHQQSLGELPVSVMPVEYLTPASERRAVAIQQVLAHAGHHRAPSISELLIAATAELAGLTVLHFDQNFELIAGFTDQPLERLSVDDGCQSMMTGDDR